jgi:hypothetical protein
MQGIFWIGKSWKENESCSSSRGGSMWQFYAHSAEQLTPQVIAIGLMELIDQGGPLANVVTAEIRSMIVRNQSPQ